MNSKGLLVTFEGIEGSGKSTMMQKLGIWIFDKFGIAALVLREPGSTEIGEAIRKVLLNKEYKGKMDEYTEAFLFQAARAQLVREKIIPDLDNGNLILLDRYGDSSEAYQGGGRGIGVYTIRGLNNLSTRKIVPDITFLFDVDVETGLRRRNLAKGGTEINRLDLEEIAFYEAVRRAYLNEAENNNANRRWFVVDANAPEDEVFEIITDVTEFKLRESGYLERFKKGKER